MWTELTKAILLRFGLTDFEDPSEALTKLQQNTTFITYYKNFEKLSHQVGGVPKKFFIGYFIAGLHDEIRLDVKIKHATTLAEAIGVTQLIEERNQLQKKTIQPYHTMTTTTKLNINPTIEPENQSTKLASNIMTYYHPRST